MTQYHNVSFQISRLITQSYSTSFSFATRLFEKEMREAIYSIYGFVRLADEIVDTFHGHDKEYLLDKFESDYYDAVKHGISLNPVLHSFQKTVKKHQISDEHIQAFLTSMRSDLVKRVYKDKAEADEYIYGSANVVGLMCLKVFCNGNETLRLELEESAQCLGSAFQKVNFLRDLENDTLELGRIYFPELTVSEINEEVKAEIITSIQKDFDIAWIGLKRLPGRSKLAVYIAYRYYLALLKKIKNTPAKKVITTRIRISNLKKIAILGQSCFAYKLKMV